MEKQDWEGKELDKDLLDSSLGEYSPESCCFVDKRINLLLGTSDGKRGNTLLGVTLHKTAVKNKFMARCGQKYLGLFHTQDLAHKRWKEEKASAIEDALSESSVPAQVRDNLIELAKFLREYNGVVDNLYELISKEKRQSLLVNV